jgi:hypothetical protein
MPRKMEAYFRDYPSSNYPENKYLSVSQLPAQALAAQGVVGRVGRDLALPERAEGDQLADHPPTSTLVLTHA